MSSQAGMVKHIEDEASLPSLTRVFAKIISYLFHPLLIPLYIAWFFIDELRLFSNKTNWGRTIVFLQFFIYYSFFPLMTTLLLKALGFVQTVYLKTQRDRIIPYIVCELFYFWAWYVFKNVHFPKEAILFALGTFLACSLGLILNSYMKISMHTISLGVLCAFLLLASTMSFVHFGFYITIGFLIAGITATSRLIDSNHTQKEIYFGFFAGAIAQVIAWFFV